MIRLLAAAALSVAVPAAAAPLIVDNGRLFITARINGVATEALLDSGAEASIVDPALAAQAKLPEGTAQTIKGSGGSEQARIVEGVTIEALGATVHPEAIVVLDLADLSRRLIKRPTRAIVGRELFDAARLRIDIAHGTIASVGKDAVPAGTRLPLSEHAGIESIPVTANGIPAQAEFDLGNGSGVLISRAFAAKLKLKAIGAETGGGIGGARKRELVRLDTLDVAGTRFRKLLAAVDDQPNANDLNIGTSVLRSFLITTDFTDRAVWLAPVAKGN